MHPESYSPPYLGCMPERDFIRKQAGARKADEEDGDESTAHKGEQEHPTAQDPATCASGTATPTPGTTLGMTPEDLTGQGHQHLEQNSAKR
jgi:hypothetical protein